MKKWQKLLRKISPQDRVRLERAIIQILSGDFSDLDFQKLEGYDHIFRARVGNYRIIYFFDGRDVILKAVKKRDESTYRAF